MCFAPQRRALFRHLNFQKWSDIGVFCTFWLGNVLRATTACTFSTSELPKVVRHWCVLYILTSKCASRHNGVHFFDISTSKSGPTLVCFVHFDFQMCFAPQRRALFRHRNFQKWSDIGVFCTFWLPNVLRATTACTFSTSQLPKVVRSSSVLSILTWKCASRHNGVHFFMSHLASWLRTRRFSEPTFRPSGAPNHWKNTVNRDFPIFSRIYLFFLLILSLLTLLTSAFQQSILSEVSLLNFLRLWLCIIIIIYDSNFFTLLYSAEVPASTRRCNERWLTHLAVWPCVSLMNGPGPSAAPVAKQHSRWRSATFCEFGRPFNRQAPRGPLWRTKLLLGAESLLLCASQSYEGQNYFGAQNRCDSAAPVKAITRTVQFELPLLYTN